MAIGAAPAARGAVVTGRRAFQQDLLAEPATRKSGPAAPSPASLSTQARVAFDAGKKRLEKRRRPMTVKRILASKGNEVLTIEPTALLAAAVKLLSERRIGALVVTGADHRIVGIISERDIVRALGARGAPVLEEPIAEVMTRKVVTCSERDTTAELMERMTAGKFRHLPVVDQGRLLGIVSIGDVVKSRLEEMQHDTEALQDYIRTA
jgi:CBS domain-containing protein